MKNRMTLGFRADAAETAALTMVESPFAPSREDFKTRWANEIHDLVEIARYHYSNDGARVAYASLHRRGWRKSGLKKSTFYKIRKKVEKLFCLEKRGQKRCRKTPGKVGCVD